MGLFAVQCTWYLVLGSPHWLIKYWFVQQFYNNHLIFSGSQHIRCALKEEQHLNTFEEGFIGEKIGNNQNHFLFFNTSEGEKCEYAFLSWIGNLKSVSCMDICNPIPNSTYHGAGMGRRGGVLDRKYGTTSMEYRYEGKE